MPVWVIIPTASIENASKNIPLWREKGYKVAMRVDSVSDEGLVPADCPFLGIAVDQVDAAPYKGFAVTINETAKEIVYRHQDCTAVVYSGDDTYPVSNDPMASSLERDFVNHFEGTLGVMVPTGDRWIPRDLKIPSSENSCNTAWLGREYVLRAYMGTGPLFEGYYHYWVDKELQDVLIAQKLLWQNKASNIYHDHWTRSGTKSRPSYLVKAKTTWDEAFALYQARKATGFPGSELL